MTSRALLTALFFGLAVPAAWAGGCFVYTPDLLQGAGGAISASSAGGAISVGPGAGIGGSAPGPTTTGPGPASSSSSKASNGSGGAATTSASTVASSASTVASSASTGQGGAGGNGPCHPVINELQTASDASGQDKWVEIYNGCGTALSGWTLAYKSANDGNPITLYTFDASNVNAYLLIAYNGATIENNAVPDGTWGAGALAQAGGAVALIDSNSNVIDSVAYQTVLANHPYIEGTAAPNPAKSNSLARIPNGADTDNNSADFKVSATPTPRAKNQ